MFQVRDRYLLRWICCNADYVVQQKWQFDIAVLDDKTSEVLETSEV